MSSQGSVSDVLSPPENPRLSFVSESTIGGHQSHDEEDAFYVRSTPEVPNSPVMPVKLVTVVVRSDNLNTVQARADNEYEEDIVKTWVRKQMRLHTTSRILELQEAMTRDVYANAIRSIKRVCDVCKLNDDTLPLAAQIVARILAMFQVPESRFPYLTIAALHIAAKYCNTQAPHIQDYAYVLGISIDTAKVIQMESVVLGALSYELGLPTAHTFAMAWIDHAGLTNHSDCVHMVQLLLQLCVVEVSMLDFSPSVIAASVVLTALSILNIKSVDIDWYWDVTQESRELGAVNRHLMNIIGGLAINAMPPAHNAQLTACATKALRWARAQSPNSIHRDL